MFHSFRDSEKAVETDFEVITDEEVKAFEEKAGGFKLPLVNKGAKVQYQERIANEIPKRMYGKKLKKYTGDIIMKKIISFILVIAVCLSFSVTSFGAVTNVFNFYDKTTGTHYFFGEFEDTDEKVGFEIRGKEYELHDVAFEKAKSLGNKFGIGIRDISGKLDTSYTVTPYYYSGDTKTLQEDNAFAVDNYPIQYNLLESITVKGKEINAFSPYKTLYYYALYDGESLKLSDIEAIPAMEYAKSAVTETENGFVVTTTSVYEEPATVEIITVEKGEYQPGQSATLNGYKNINIYYPLKAGSEDEYEETPVVKVNYTKGSAEIYDANEQRIKANINGGIIQKGETNPRGAILIQYDISEITNINDKVILNLPVYLKVSADKVESFPGDIGVVGVDNEAYIERESYYKGSKDAGTGIDSVPYNEALANLNTNPTDFMKNAVSMIDVTKLDNEVAPRVHVTREENGNNKKTIKSIDVTDYVRSKMLAGEDTVTFLVRAFQNHELSGALSNEAQITVVTKESTLEFTGYEGDVALSDIRVNGISLSDFDKDTLNYNVTIDDASELPVVTVSVADEENLSCEVINATEIPGQATIKVKAFDGQSKTYTVNFALPFKRGTFTLSDTYKLERKPGFVTINKFLTNKNASDGFITGRVYNASGDPRDEAMLKFTTTAEGLNAEDKVMLTVSAKARDDLGVSGGSVRIVGIVDENYTYDTVVPTVDRNYVFTTTEGLSKEYKEFSFDVTPYVNARLASGSSQISFLVELVDADWQSGDGDVSMDMAIAPFNIEPKLEYMPASLSSLKYGENNIAVVDGQKTYVVTLDDASEIPVVSATAASSKSVVSVTQATEVPGYAEINVTTNGVVDTYKVAFIPSDYAGTAVFENVYSATYSAAPSQLNSNAAVFDLTKKYLSVKTNDYGDINQEGIVKFDIQNMIGIPEGKRVILTVNGYGNPAAITNEVQLSYKSVIGEAPIDGYRYGANSVFTGSVSITTSAVDKYSFDVTDYVKSKIASGETTVTFALSITPGVAKAIYYWRCDGKYAPVLTIE